MMGEVGKDDTATDEKKKRKTLKAENGEADDEDDDDVMKSNVLSDEDSNVFNWSDITTQEFVDGIKSEGTLGRVLIH